MMEHGSCILVEDVLGEILCRLPDKALVRFKMVSKAWNLFISEICSRPMPKPKPMPVVGLFVRTYYNILGQDNINVVEKRDYHGLKSYFSSAWLPDARLRVKSLGGLYASLESESSLALVFGWKKCLRSYGLPFEANPDEFLGCYNGLLLFTNKNKKGQCFYVSNPYSSSSTRQQCISIPPLPLPQRHDYLFAALAFDPAQLPHFKIVRFEMVLDDDEEEAYVVLDIYSSARGSWTRHSVAVDPQFCKIPCIRAATYFNGTLFRLSHNYQILRFQIHEKGEEEEEVTTVIVGKMKLPLRIGECNGTIGCLGVLMGELCYGLGYDGTIRIWSHHHSYPRSWKLRHTIPICDLTRRGSFDSSKWVEPIAFHPSDNVVYIGTPAVILAYHLENNEFEVLFRNLDRYHFLPASYHPPSLHVRYLGPLPTPTPAPVQEKEEEDEEEDDYYDYEDSDDYEEEMNIQSLIGGCSSCLNFYFEVEEKMKVMPK